MPVNFQQKASYGIDDLLEIMALLRGEDGCPWDREQDHHSIRRNFLEETYEVLEAIDTGDPVLLREELGDVLLQVVFHARLEQEAGRFDFGDVCDGICKKLILRHPHVFGTAEVSDSGEVTQNWDRIKAKSKGQTTASQTLESVPRVLPALLRSDKIQSRAAKAGFAYPEFSWAMKDLESELEELKEAAASGSEAQIGEELGDLLFAAVNVARMLHQDPEERLDKACEKFIGRFTQVEQLVLKRGIDLKTASAEQLSNLWSEAKALRM